MTIQPHGEQGPLQALVIHPNDRDGEMLLRSLQRIGCHCSHAWPPPDELPPQLDVVFYLIDQRTKGPFHWLNDHPAVATIAGGMTGIFLLVLFTGVYFEVAGPESHAARLVEPFAIFCGGYGVALVLTLLSATKRLHEIRREEAVNRSVS